MLFFFAIFFFSLLNFPLFFNLKNFLIIINPSLLLFLFLFLFSQSNFCLILIFQFFNNFSKWIVITKHLNYFYLRFGFIRFWCEIFINVIKKLFIWDYLTKDWMFLIKIRLLRKTNKKLTSVCTWPRIRHTQHSWMVLQFWRELILKRFTKDRLSPSPSSSRITSLKTKVFNKPMENSSIKITFFT